MNKKILSFIYNKKKNKFLILKTNGDEPEVHGKSHWFTTTGSVEKEESYEEAVRREVKEETDLDVKEIYFLKWGCRYEWADKECDELYHMAFVENDVVKLNEEHVDYKWLGLDDFVKEIDWKGNKVELKTFLKLGVNKNIDFKPIRIDDFTSKKDKIIFINDDEESHLTFYYNSDFSKLKDVRQVYGICFDDNGMILVINTTGNWCLPGGTPEKGESFEETLRREVDEEGDVDIDNLIPIGYNKIEVHKDGMKKEIFYQLRYVCSIIKLKKQTIDPAKGEIPERKFIGLNEFFSYCPWGRTAEEMIKIAKQINLLYRKE